MRDHGFGDRVGVGTDIIKFYEGPLAGAAPWLHQATVSFCLPEKLRSTNWRRNQIDQVQQSVMLAQIFFVCGNLFSKKFCAINFTRAEKFLSSSRVINAARVVQKRHSEPARCIRGKISPGSLCIATFRRFHATTRIIVFPAADRTPKNNKT
jgi:hypothetical protein